MSAASKEISVLANKLPPNDRLDLVERLLDSLDTPDQAIDQAWTAEAEDRLSAYRRGEIDAVPIADVLAKCKAK